jgi:hypothetical protein
MGGRNSSRSETHHLTCPVCGALPQTTCIDWDYQELKKIHASRRMPVAERNRRSAEGWEPPELAERHRRALEARAAPAPALQPAGQVRRSFRPEGPPGSTGQHPRNRLVARPGHGFPAIR